EPVAEIRHMVDQLGLDCFILYDMAHVLGLVGRHFQQPFLEGADIVTGSTHKTYFGTQRGLIGTNYAENDVGFEFWEAIQRRAFPGSTSNHHLGTMLGLLISAYEMNAFREEYQPKVLANAKAFACSLKDSGLEVAGDPAISYTETHQVVVHVGYGRGPEVARRLEDNNIVVNYQAAPDEEGFTASGALRMGVQEMTRFGMEAGDFAELAGYIRDVIVQGANVREEVSRFRRRFLQLHYCFSDPETEALLAEVRALI
ncbi:MAG: glycine cleavage system protein T, partial [Desulfobacteraceae bacterium]|nr:glycine cleavage system protein T [Desulfobacteraceae bacterium]